MNPNDKGKEKYVPRERVPLRGGSSRGRGRTRGRGAQSIPPPSYEQNEFQQLFADEQIPGLETVGGGEGASLSLSDLDEDQQMNFNIPLADVENFLDGENERDQGNPRPSSSRSTGFQVEVEGKCNLFYVKS